MLSVEYKDICESIRGLFGNFLSWFTFFTGVNFAGYGWFAKQLIDNPRAARGFILMVCVYFIIQHVFAWYATVYLIKYLIDSKNRLTQILPEISKSNETNITPKIGLPIALYIVLVKSMQYTYPTMIFLWVSFTVFAFVKH